MSVAGDLMDFVDIAGFFVFFFTSILDKPSHKNNNQYWAQIPYDYIDDR